MPFPMAKGAAWAICSISCCSNRDRHRGCQSARKFEAIGFKIKVEADTWVEQWKARPRKQSRSLNSGHAAPAPAYRLRANNGNRARELSSGASILRRMSVSWMNISLKST
jgi:hypothetical protein